MARVIFYGTCQFSGCDMTPIEEELDIDQVNLDLLAQEFADDWAGVEGWYEVIEEEEE